eukprot:TRINITY_DN6865_c0_g1_i3.p2 TRINITY_DN6865_c0_g1~~TRINITY_DN6865_c0_g1_i3.p2  ORF type:complete len:146 (+),score=69.37 TRINITY_DN6865_c0_g1_i3:227-664(+)
MSDPSTEPRKILKVKRAVKKVNFAPPPGAEAEAAPAAANVFAQPVVKRKVFNTPMAPLESRPLTKVGRRKMGQRTSIMTQEEREAMKARYREQKKARKQMMKGFGKKKRERRLEEEKKRSQEEALGGTVDHAMEVDQPSRKRRRM